MNFTTLCTTQEALLEEEVNAWSKYWTKLHKCAPQADLDSLREAAMRISSAVETHAEKCPICKAEK
jgi:hypothetical protein